jgi:hypothetical protein
LLLEVHPGPGTPHHLGSLLKKQNHRFKPTEPESTFSTTIHAHTPAEEQRLQHCQGQWTPYTLRLYPWSGEIRRTIFPKI